MHWLIAIAQTVKRKKQNECYQKIAFQIGSRFTVLYLLFIVLFVVGSMAVTGVMPATTTSEPGLVSEVSGLLTIASANVLVISFLILTSRWSAKRFEIG
jgi:hypothetical protein